jgi:hypothetical protein
MGLVLLVRMVWRLALAVIVFSLDPASTLIRRSRSHLDVGLRLGSRRTWSAHRGHRVHHIGGILLHCNKYFAMHKLT